jgi:hypothetical protein
MEITTTKENLIEKLVQSLNNNLLVNLANSDLDEDEKQANIVLARKSILSDAQNISDMVFKAFE